MPLDDESLVNTTKSGLEQTIGGVSAVANKNKDDLSSLSGTVNTLSTTVDKKANAEDVEASIKTINDNAAALGDRVSANETAISDIQKDIKDVVKVNIAANAKSIATNESNINANAALINTNAGNITKNTQSITNILNGTKLDSFKDVEDEIVRSIGASNAMVFKGVLGGTDGLAQVPTTNEQGWTYKVAAAGTYAGHTCKVGDLLIALKDNATTASADWAYIPSGGEDFDNVVLESVAGSTSIKISDDLNHVHGSVEIASGNESLEIDGSVADKISISMVWGTWN